MADHNDTRSHRRINIKKSHETLRFTVSDSNMAASGQSRNLDSSGNGSPNRSYPPTEGMFRRSDSMAQISNRLIEMLDHVEQRVELLREQASSMEQERDCLLGIIKNIQANKDLTYVSEGEREEIQVNAERLLTRCLTVEVQVSTPRNEVQEKALQLVNKYIDDLVSRVRSDIEGSKRHCQAFLNACLSDAKGPIDQKFQAAIIECTADDQKKTRKRLESLLRTIEHSEKNMR